MRKLLSGNEAIAQGAWEAGVHLAAAYPGTPSTEILEHLATLPGVYCEWYTNEKVALDVAVGAAYAGRRALCTMKHVGLNVAADSFFYASMTGAEAGLVLVSADDPAMHSSQNEQDNRRFAKFARVPCLEPSDSQEAKELAVAAFELSEAFDTPVMLRITTRIAHSSTPVQVGERQERPPRAEKFPREIAKYTMLPANARGRHPAIEERVQRLAEFAGGFPANRVEWRDRSLGIVTCGVAYQYAREVFPKASTLHLRMSYPIPPQMVREFAAGVERLIVIEELDPFLEEEIKLLGIACEGKSIFPLLGELDPRTVREASIAAGLLPASAHVPLAQPDKGNVPIRPPVLCPGCPHRSVYYAAQRFRVPINGDIGCYTLGVMPPLTPVSYTCGCMGASIGVAHGADKAGDGERHIATLGDSTFFHTGLPALANAVYNQSRVVTTILDNRITAMTGHQQNPGTGLTLMGQPTKEIPFEPLVRALGVEEVHAVDAFNVRQVRDAFKACLAYDGPSVIIATGACALLPESRQGWMPLEVDQEACVACGTCMRIGCPAIVKQADGKSWIDPLLCVGCEVCAQLCPKEAILTRERMQAKQAAEG
ncbi:MAG: indolepyruvate ferredoxin oxidoreductase subunit alpha [Chloroflexi bacterium]|nr:indolepyruvate ferredoxin oxidoreductase subunit alpha [Chloroflexota bacterium]